MRKYWIVLHARTEHDNRARTCRALLRIRHAGYRFDAVLSQSLAGPRHVERAVTGLGVLGNEHRADAGDGWELPAGGIDANVGIGEIRLLGRSAEFLSSPTVQTIKWSRIFGDTVFALGAVALVVFVFGLAIGYSRKKDV